MKQKIEIQHTLISAYFKIHLEWSFGAINVYIETCNWGLDRSNHKAKMGKQLQMDCRNAVQDSYPPLPSPPLPSLYLSVQLIPTYTMLLSK